MSSLGNETLDSNSSLDDFLIREIMLTHDPDDRIELDSELLLSLVESVVCSTLSDVSDLKSDVEIEGSIDMIQLEEPVTHTLYKISHEILCRCFEHANMHKKTMVLLEMVSHFGWDAKVVLVLAAFVPSYGLFWLIKRLQTDDLLALSLALLKQVLPRDITTFDPKSKALVSLIKCMVKVTKVIIMVENTPLSHGKAMAITKSKIYLATYWIIRSILECSSQIADLRSLRHEQVYSDAQIVTAWMLYSLSNKLNRLCRDLEEQIEKSLKEKLAKLFKEKHIDNQEVLKTLFSCKIELPSNHHASKKKVDIFELKRKVLILLISKPDLLPIDKLLLLVKQTYDHPQHKQNEENYAILWVPITSSNEWSVNDKINFEFFSRSFPWLSVRQPWMINSTVVNFIKQEWNFKEEPLLVVLDVDGMVTNMNAMDMVLIWGPKAFPFSTLREKELWEKEKWSLGLIINGISPLLNNHEVEEGKNICIYGSENIDWIRDFTAKMKKLKDGGIKLQLVHVGCRNATANHFQNIIDIINQENLSTSLTSPNTHFFWFRLETIKTSIAHQENRDKIAKELADFLDFGETKEGWAVFGKDFSAEVIKLSRESDGELGFVGAIGGALKASFHGESCDHSELVPYEEGLNEKSVVCGVCRRTMKKFVVYKCDVVAE